MNISLISILSIFLVVDAQSTNQEILNDVSLRSHSKWAAEIRSNLSKLDQQKEDGKQFRDFELESWRISVEEDPRPKQASKAEHLATETLKSILLIRNDFSTQTTLNRSLNHGNEWNRTGYKVLSKIVPEDALAVIEQLPLVSYILQHDAKRFIHASSSFEKIQLMRTRRHVGVIDMDFLEALAPEAIPVPLNIDRSVLFYLNLKAIDHLSHVYRAYSDHVQSISIYTKELKESISLLSSEVTNYSSHNLPNILMETYMAEVELMNIKLKSAYMDVKRSHRLRNLYTVTKRSISELVHKENQTARMHSLENFHQHSRDLDILDLEYNVDDKIERLKAEGLLKRENSRLERQMFEMEAKMEYEIKRAKKEIEIEMELERKSEPASLNRIRIIGEEAIKEAIQITEALFQKLASSITYILMSSDGKSQFITHLAYFALLCFCLAFSKDFSEFIFIIAYRQLMSPRLVREYGNTFLQAVNITSQTRASIDDVVLDQRTHGRIRKLCSQAMNAGKRNFSPPNILLYGMPGTGKSLLAKAFGDELSHMPYARMSASDLAPLGPKGPAEMRKVLKWASGGKGRIVIIEDAEAAFGTRRGQKNEFNSNDIYEPQNKSKTTTYSRDALNVFLSMTGNSYNDFMLILTSSSPHKLDEAVLDRMDEIIQLPKPGIRESEMILKRELFRTIRISDGSKATITRRIENTKLIGLFGKAPQKRKGSYNFSLSNKIEGLIQEEDFRDLSGRELKKLARSIAEKLIAFGILNQETWLEVKMCISQELKDKCR